MEQLLIFLLIIVALVVIILVFMQQGKGAEAGAGFGAGASGTVFGSQGSGSFLMKLTMAFAAVFFIICIVLARMAVNDSKAARNLDVAPQQTQTQPTLPAQNAPANDNVPNVPQPSAPAKK